MLKNLKKNLWIITMVIITMLFSSCGTAENKPAVNGNIDNLTEKQWIEDIDYLHEKLPQKHKKLYHSLKKQDFDKEIADLKKDVPKLKGYEIKGRLAQIVASVGDAHTSLSLGFNENNIYPVGLWWFGKDLRVITTDKQNKDIIGEKLVSINNIPVDEIMNKINSLISHENGQWLKVINVKYISVPDVLKLLNITADDKAEFSFSDDKGGIKKLSLSPERLTDDIIVRAMDLMPDKPVRLQYNAKDPNLNLYWYKYIPEDKILYFQYNQCIDRNTAKNNSLPDFNQFSDGLIKAIDSNDIDKFVVDLRFNTGGDSSLMTKLVSRLKNIQKLKGKGKIFVMTSRQTFSSGVMACMDFKDKTQAIFYGEPTGGNVNGYGDIKMLTLPNSGLQVSYSTKYFHESDNYKEGFVPDVAVNQSFDHYMKGIDDVYEAIRNYN